MPTAPEAGRKVRVHIKNNRARIGGWPDSAEGEAVFSTTPERYAAAAGRHGEAAARVEAFIDWDEDRFAESMRTAEVLVAWDLPTERLAERAPHLRWIHIIGAGVEHLAPLDWLPDGVVLTNSRGIHADKSGEYGAMAILMLNNAMPALYTSQREARYTPIFATPAAGKTVAIIGVGAIGGAIARQAKRLGLRVLGVRRHARRARHVDRMYGPDEIDAVLPQADFVVVSAALTPETRGLLDRRRLGLMKPGAGLVNLSRAAVVDYDALADRLREGALSGAILDVFDPEPLASDSPLWAVPNLVITPHVSSDEKESYVPRTLDLFFDNMARYLAGRPLRNRVRPALGY